MKVSLQISLHVLLLLEALRHQLFTFSDAQHSGSDSSTTPPHLTAINPHIVDLPTIDTGCVGLFELTILQMLVATSSSLRLCYIDKHPKRPAPLH